MTAAAEVHFFFSCNEGKYLWWLYW